MSKRANLQHLPASPHYLRQNYSKVCTLQIIPSPHVNILYFKSSARASVLFISAFHIVPLIFSWQGFIAKICWVFHCLAKECFLQGQTHLIPSGTKHTHANPSPFYASSHERVYNFVFLQLSARWKIRGMHSNCKYMTRYFNSNQQEYTLQWQRLNWLSGNTHITTQLFHSTVES